MRTKVQICFSREFREALHQCIRIASEASGSTRASVQRAVDSLVALVVNAQPLVELGSELDYPMARLAFNVVLSQEANQAVSVFVAMQLRNPLTPEFENYIVDGINNLFRRHLAMGVRLFQVVPWEESESCSA